jgi:hypothetical protein
MQVKKVPPFPYSSGGIGFDDGEKSIMEIRKNTSDKEFENWMYQSILQEKEFVSANTLMAGST